MNIPTLLFRIKQYLLRLQADVIVSNSINETDVNRRAEFLLARIFSVLFEAEIINANSGEKRNIEGIDLIDKNEVYAFQVTSTRTGSKTIDSIKKYIEYKYYLIYKILFIVLIGEYKKNFRKSTIDRIKIEINERFEFDKRKNIIDLVDLYEMIEQKNDSLIFEKVCEALEEYYGDIDQSNKMLLNLNEKIDRLFNLQPNFIREYENENPISLSFDYRSLYTSFLGREDEFELLCLFYEGTAKFRWWSIIGKGGIGKSRLALEFCNRVIVEGGFIHISEIKRISWLDWQPLEDTVIVVDYVSVYYKDTIELIDKLASRSDLQFKVRLLLLERNINGEWWGKIKSSYYAKNTCYKNDFRPLYLTGLNDDQLFLIIKKFNSERDQFEKQEIIEDLINIDPLRRPLFAMFAGLSLRFNVSLRGWDQNRLLEFLLERERNHIWVNHAEEEELYQHNNLLILVTVISGVDEKMMDVIFDKEIDWLPSREVFNGDLYNIMTGYSDDKDELDLVPLMPDILGEYFVLNNLKNDIKYRYRHKNRSKELMNLSWKLSFFNSWSFVRKSVEDFSSHSSLPLLFEVPQFEELPEGAFPYIDLVKIIHEQMDVKINLDDPEALINLFECVLIISKRYKSEKFSLADLDVGLALSCDKMVMYYAQKDNFELMEIYYNSLKDLSDNFLRESYINTDLNKLKHEFDKYNAGQGSISNDVADYRKDHRQTFIFESYTLTKIINYLFKLNNDDVMDKVIKYFNRLEYLYERKPKEIRILLELMKNVYYKEYVKKNDPYDLNVLSSSLSILENYYSIMVITIDDFVYDFDKAEVYVIAIYQINQMAFYLREFDLLNKYYSQAFQITIESNSDSAFKALINDTSWIVGQLSNLGLVKGAYYFQEHKDFLQKLKPYLGA